VCSNQPTIEDMVPVTLPSGETVYMTVSQAMETKLSVLVEMLTAMTPAKVFLWTGVAVAILFVGAVALPEIIPPEPAPPPPRRRR
jgi:hypothetical protein